MGQCKRIFHQRVLQLLHAAAFTGDRELLSRRQRHDVKCGELRAWLRQYPFSRLTVECGERELS